MATEDPWTGDLTADVLRNLGYQVLRAGDGHEALRILETGAGRIDLLVTSVVLAGINGLELAARSKALFPALKTMYVSAPDDMVQVCGAIHPGSASLTKPFTREQLGYELGNLIGES